jgi:NTE family protein
MDGTPPGLIGGLESAARRLIGGSEAPPALSLALQGGGSLGAYTWGVLDRLLEEEDLSLDAISGASAGAVNAVITAAGLAAGGPAEARRRLEHFWTRLGEAPGLQSMTSALSWMVGYLSLGVPDLNPLRDRLAEVVDFERLRHDPPVSLLIAATRVKDGTLRIFREHEVSIDVVLASACLPMIHHTVEIDGEAYWDGGFSANPPLRQLALDSTAGDILLVQIMPQRHPDVPRLQSDIAKRINQFAFSIPLQKELEALQDLTELSRAGGLAGSPLARRLRRLRLHRLVAEETVEGLEQMSPLSRDRTQMQALKAAGRAAADNWLQTQQAVSAASR